MTSSLTVKVLNLGSRYAGWLDDVQQFLSELNDTTKLEQAIPQVPARDIRQRLTELKYVCLVGQLSLAETRQRYPRVLTDHVESWAHFLRITLQEMSSPPLRYEDDPFEESDLLDDEAATGEAMHADEELGEAVVENSARQPPHFGGHKNQVEVIVDCYGLYVTSLHSWLKHMAHGAKNREIRSLRQQLDQAPTADGPAILLCPELIATIHSLVIGGAPLSVRRYLTLDRNPDRLFLKFVLFHELGHHFYPLHQLATLRYLPETMANWFLYNMLDAQERAVLHEKTLTQSLEYHTYNGILAIYHFPFLFFPPLWPTVLSGFSFISSLERAAFYGIIEPWPLDWVQHWTSSSRFPNDLTHSSIYNYLYNPLMIHKPRWRIHPICVLGLFVLCDAYQYFRDLLTHFAKLGDLLVKSESVASQLHQRNVLERIWRQPRIV